MQYEGSGTSDRRFLHADERGPIVAASDASGNLLSINTYDEYGKPGASNQGRFQYTGQMWLPQIGLYHYKARAYAAHLGRFWQTDPIGTGGGINLYAYVGNDPLNLSDPSGLCAEGEVSIVMTGSRIPRCVKIDAGGGNESSGGSINSGTGSNGGNGGMVGGPFAGGPCIGCISGSDSRAGSSILAHEGFYYNGVWSAVVGPTQLSSTMLHQAGSDPRKWLYGRLLRVFFKP